MRGQRPGLGVALILGMASCFATMDAFVKLVGASVPVLLILWVRYATQALSMGAWLAATRRAALRSAHPRFQIVRGLLLLTTSALAFVGLQHLPVAEFTAINMLSPLLVTLLAGVVLGEQVSALRWAVIGGGLAGALIVVRPGAGLYGWAALLPLAAALSYASFQVLSRKLSALESPYTTHFLTGLVGLVVLTPLLLGSGTVSAALVAALGPAQLGQLLLIGVLGTAGHLMLVLAIGMAPTATLMPFTYVQIAVAAAAGWVAFGHVPDGWAWVGMAVIAACGAAGVWMNLRAARPEAIA